MGSRRDVRFCCRSRRARLAMHDAALAGVSENRTEAAAAASVCMSVGQWVAWPLSEQTYLPAGAVRGSYRSRRRRRRPAWLGGEAAGAGWPGGVRTVRGGCPVRRAGVRCVVPA